LFVFTTTLVDVLQRNGEIIFQRLLTTSAQTIGDFTRSTCGLSFFATGRQQANFTALFSGFGNGSITTATGSINLCHAGFQSTVLTGNFGHGLVKSNGTNGVFVRNT